MKGELNCSFISHSTIEEGLTIKSGWKFLKVWNVINNGTIQWPEGTTLEFVNGTSLHISQAKIPLLKPGEEGKITGPMQAPVFVHFF